MLKTKTPLRFVNYNISQRRLIHLIKNLIDKGKEKDYFKYASRTNRKNSGKAVDNQRRVKRNLIPRTAAAVARAEARLRR